MESLVDTNNHNYAFLAHNGEGMSETWYFTTSWSGYVATTGGREILVKAEEGDTLSLRTNTLMHGFYHILTCFQYNAV